MGLRYFIILLLILMACEPVVQTVPTSDYQPTITDTAESSPVDLCKDVNCTNGQVCNAGKCACSAEQKLCGNECIPKERCCTNSDCDTGLCANGVCITPKECEFGQRSQDGECKCAEGKFYCEEQKTCIDNNKCCRHTECQSFEKCMQTNLKTSLCIEIEEKKVCKTFMDQDRTETYDVKNNTFKAKPTNWWNDQSVTFDVNNQSIRLKFNELTNFSNATIYQEGITVTGGYCKEDEG
ncbi:Uncharacterised protein [uncultured archaeon]|nr:Uncharacterised protein [uncultured archaeon]